MPFPIIPLLAIAALLGGEEPLPGILACPKRREMRLTEKPTSMHERSSIRPSVS